VLVWVHGGGNVEGSGEWPPLGVMLARTGIVVVSLNYRLGAFGFFTYSGLDAESKHHTSGNYGHLDQIAALEWVLRNIAQFGGDPRRVTIAGQSSGSEDVCNLMTSPLAAELFEGAILESGTCVDAVFPQLRKEEASGERLAKDLGVRAGPPGFEQLRAIPAGDILEAAARDRNVDLEPNIDGWVLPSQPAITFARGRQARVPVMLGTNEDEVSIFASPLVGGHSYRPRTVAEYRAWLNREFGGFADEVFAAYPSREDAQVRVPGNVQRLRFRIQRLAVSKGDRTDRTASLPVPLYIRGQRTLCEFGGFPQRRAHVPEREVLDELGGEGGGCATVTADGWILGSIRKDRKS
jgi:para-nitrobenzyl esterase